MGVWSRGAEWRLELFGEGDVEEVGTEAVRAT